MRRSRYVNALIFAVGVVAIGVSSSHADFVTSFEFGQEGAYDGLIPLTQEMFPELPAELNLAEVNLLPIPEEGLVVPFPDGTNTMMIGTGAVVATIGLQDFYYGPDGGLYELAFPSSIWFENPVEDLSFTFWSSLSESGTDPVNGGFANVQAFDANMDPVGDPVLPNLLIFETPGMEVGIEDFVSFDGPVSHLVWTTGAPMAPGEGWGIDFLSATTISNSGGAVPEPGTAILFGLGLAALVTRSRSVE